MTSFLVMAFFADYLEAFGPLGFLVKLGVTLTFLLVYSPSALSLSRASWSAISLVCFYLLYCFSHFSSLASSLYELFKLLPALILVLGCIHASRNPNARRSSPARLETRLRHAMSSALVINALAVAVQVLIGNKLLIQMGVPIDYFDSPEKAGRFSGLILNLPLWSSMLFVRILLSDSKLFRVDAWPLKPWQLVATYGLLLLSGQKYVLVCAALHLLLRMSLGKRAILAVALLLAAPMLTSSENHQIADRVKQADQIVEEGVAVLIAESDAQADYPQFSFLDRRLNSWLYAWAHLRDLPEGRGLGTWGDFSAKLNPSIEDPVTLSESQWAHVIVEQGYGALLLIFLMCTPAVFANKTLRGNLRWLGFFIFLAGWFTMGSSDYLWFFTTYVLLFNVRAIQGKEPARRRTKLPAAPARLAPN